MKYAVLFLILTACSTVPSRQPSAAKDETISAWLNSVSKPEVFFIGDNEEYARFVCHLERLGRTVGNLEMPGEVRTNGIDDNGDEFIDNSFGWDGVHAMPYFPEKLITSGVKFVGVHPFFVEHPMPMKHKGERAGAMDVILAAKGLHADPNQKGVPTYVFIPDEADREQFIVAETLIVNDPKLRDYGRALLPYKLIIFGHPLEPCGALTN